MGWFPTRIVLPILIFIFILCVISVFLFSLKSIYRKLSYWLDGVGWSMRRRRMLMMMLILSISSSNIISSTHCRRRHCRHRHRNCFRYCFGVLPFKTTWMLLFAALLSIFLLLFINNSK